MGVSLSAVQKLGSEASFGFAFEHYEPQIIHILHSALYTLE